MENESEQEEGQVSEDEIKVGMQVPMNDPSAWDDTLLIKAWDDAMSEYKLNYSIESNNKRKPKNSKQPTQKKQKIDNEAEQVLGKDELLSQMMMSWYYAGYYTGLYQSKYQ